MPRPLRNAPAGVVFHILNRGVGRRQIFEKQEDFASFERVMAYSLASDPVDLLAFCLMPNHWHLLVRPTVEGQLGRFMQRLTMTPTRRWQEHHQRVGEGHFYQGRFKSFPVENDAHFLTVARYVERNPLRATLVDRAEQWRWSSLYRRLDKGGDEQRVAMPLAIWPVKRSRDWLAWVNEPQTEKELAALRLAVTRGGPFGSSKWRESMTERLGLQFSQRPRGRPKGKVKNRT